MHLQVFLFFFFCLYAKLGGENDELIVLTGFCCLHAAVCSGPESCLRCTKRLQTCVVGVLFFPCCWLFMLEYVLRAALQAFFSPLALEWDRDLSQPVVH